MLLKLWSVIRANYLCNFEMFRSYQLILLIGAETLFLSFVCIYDLIVIVAREIMSLGDVDSRSFNVQFKHYSGIHFRYLSELK